MSNIWFFSDPHFGHKNMCRGLSEWKELADNGKQKTRDFATLEEMDSKLVNNINSRVEANDEMYCLGDWSFGGIDNVKRFRERIVCNNIHLIFGNHDHHIENPDKGLQALFASVQYYKEMKYDRGKYSKIILSHYAFRIWNDFHHGVIHLYGHSHGTLPDPGNKSMDVGVDTNNLFPYKLEEILAIMKSRENKPIDHHNSKTN